MSVSVPRSSAPAQNSPGSVPISWHSQPSDAWPLVSYQPVSQLPTLHTPLAQLGVPLVIGQPALQSPTVPLIDAWAKLFTGSSVSTESVPVKDACVSARNCTSTAMRPSRGSCTGSAGMLVRVKRLELPATNCRLFTVSAPQPVLRTSIVWVSTQPCGTVPKSTIVGLTVACGSVTVPSTCTSR